MLCKHSPHMLDLSSLDINLQIKVWSLNPPRMQRRIKIRAETQMCRPDPSNRHSLHPQTKSSWTQVISGGPSLKKMSHKSSSVIDSDTFYSDLWPLKEAAYYSDTVQLLMRHSTRLHALLQHRRILILVILVMGVSRILSAWIWASAFSTNASVMHVGRRRPPAFAKSLNNRKVLMQVAKLERPLDVRVNHSRW